MLIEFRVENHRSLRDEQALTFEAGTQIGDPSDPRPRDVVGHRKKLLPAAVLYGANASGKSNVLDALDFMRQAVIFSHQLWDPAGEIPRTAFAWGDQRNEASLFEVTILVEETKYVYGFSLDDEVVQEEWLFAWPNHHKQVWFEREGDKFKFGEHLEGPNETVREVTRPNALFLSTAAQHGHALLRVLFGRFDMIVSVNIPNRGYRSLPTWLMRGMSGSEDSSRTRILQLLKAADIGIVDIKRISYQEHSGPSLPKFLLQHQADDDDSWLELDEESGGTRTLFYMAPSIFNALDSGGLLLIDELESSMHPMVASAVVKIFNSPETNPKNAQIVFTTHDTNLLGTTLGKPPLRRDQIWFTEKDAEGASRLYPLTDYKPRKAENLERGYLQGRYGAIPFLGDIAWITE